MVPGMPSFALLHLPLHAVPLNFRVRNDCNHALRIPIAQGIRDTPVARSYGRPVVAMVSRPLNIVVVGGGPVGCAVASVLARMGAGHAVTVFDRALTDDAPATLPASSLERGDLQSAANKGPPGVNMIVSDRGARALRQTGIEVTNNPQVFAPVRGVVRHGKTSGTAKEVLVDSVYMYTVSKADLTKVCRASASSAGVSFRNGCTLTQLQPGINTATFVEAAASTSPGIGTEKTSAVTRTVAYDMLLGCDGAFSKVQAELIRLGTMDLSHSPGQEDFKLIRLPPLHAFPGYRDTWLDCNHVWTQWDGPSIIAPTCVREELEIGDRLPHQGREAALLLGKASEGDLLGSANAVQAYFENIFPDVVAVFRALDKKLGRNQPDGIGKSGQIDVVENASPADSFEKFCQETAASPKLTSVSSKICVPLSSKNIALLGDAGHVMSPSLGQGMNTGFEDFAVLVECLNAAQGSAEQALALYDRERSPDVEAVVSMSNRLAKGRIFPRIELLLAEVLLSNLRKALPTVLKGRALFAELCDADLRFKEILDDRMVFLWLIRVVLAVVSGSAFGASAVAVWQSMG